MLHPKQILWALVPPLLWKAGQRVAGGDADRFEYASPELAAQLRQTNEVFWARFLEQERAAVKALKAVVIAGKALPPNADEELKYSVFGYVLAQACRGRSAVSVLDYGGNLGDYYWLARALVPEITLDYHCWELPAVVQAARELSPDVTWHTDDACFERHYDLVMFSSSLQYVDDWRSGLGRAARASKRFLLLSDVSAVRDAPPFFSLQYSSGVTTVQRHLNRTETIDAVAGSGMRLLREFDMGAHPHVANAPEQPRCTGWLFVRN